MVTRDCIGLLLNMYTPIYDSTLIIFAVLLVGIGTLNSWLIAALYLVPFVTVPIARYTGIQLYTVVLVMFLIVLIRQSYSDWAINEFPIP